ncbi:unnamed protein product, partial [Callosobruchus maculatus]
MPHFFTKEIYKLQLAPIKDESYALSTTSEGKLVYWNIETPQAGTDIIDAIQAKVIEEAQEDSVMSDDSS